MNKLSISPEKKKIITNILLIVILLFLISFILFILINNYKKQRSVSEIESQSASEVFFTEQDIKDKELETETLALLDGAEIVLDGVDLISREGKVITIEGLEVRSDVEPNSENAPRQSLAISEDELSEKVIKLKIGNGSFSPDTFSVKKGEAISLSLTGTDDTSHSIVFTDSSLRAVRININSGQTRLVSFNAPDEPGEYSFRCGFPGHFTIGEEGVMIVK